MSIGDMDENRDSVKALLERYQCDAEDTYAIQACSDLLFALARQDEERLLTVICEYYWYVCIFMYPCSKPIAMNE